MIYQVVIERHEDEEGNQWFEMTKESCDLIGFEVPKLILCGYGGIRREMMRGGA